MAGAESVVSAKTAPVHPTNRAHIRPMFVSFPEIDKTLPLPRFDLCKPCIEGAKTVNILRDTKNRPNISKMGPLRWPAGTKCVFLCKRNNRPEPETQSMSQLHTNKRYLLSRPRGGLNDVLVQLEKSRRYASQYERTLIMDTSRSGLRCDFNDLFIVGDDFGCEVVNFSDQISAELDKSVSIKPANLINRTSHYQTEWDKNDVQYRDPKTGTFINFDHRCDHPEQILVYEQAGGGLEGLSFLRHVAFSPDIANIIANRLLPLGTDYDAIHVRHTDYQTDYEQLFRQSKNLFKNRQLLLCSDNKQVKDSALSYFDTTTKLLSVSEIPDIDGEALHFSDQVDAKQTNIDLLCDLIAMSRARRFLFTKLYHTETKRPRFSGFAVLAESLRREPETIRSLLKYADAKVLEKLFLTNNRSTVLKFAPSRIMAGFQRWFFKLDLWRWNFKAQEKSRLIGQNMRSKPHLVDVIPPNYFE